MHNAIIGSKAESLLKLKKEGYRIPAFFTIDSENTGTSLQQEDIISRLPGAKFFAVRSSAAGEDSAEKSFAGHFYSAIGLHIEDVGKEVIETVSSYKGIFGGVIIQEFIPSDKAGVIFSDAGNGKVIVNSNFGLCDSVVKGEMCDEYILDKAGVVISKHISKKRPHIFDGQKIVMQDFTAEESLNVDELTELAKMAHSVEKYMGTPQDIEWCFKGKTLYLLQSRPITRKIFNLKPVYFDSANIAESYSGIVLPLTSSYASFIYRTVYEDLLVHSGVSRKKLARHEDVFSNMLGFFYGRMYYNMNNWYKMTAFIPGYKRNKRNLELMITSNIKEEVEHDIAPSVWLKIKYPFLCLVKLLFHPIAIGIFKRKVALELKKVRAMPIHEFTFEETKQAYLVLVRKLLKNWYITVENDFVVMTCFGILKKVYGEEVLNDLIRFKSASSEQIGELSRLSANMQDVPELWRMVESEDKEGFYKEMKNCPAIEKQLEKYYEKFGGRFANELKLESPDIEEDFGKFAKIIRLYSKSDLHQAPSREVNLPGRFFKRLLMTPVLKKFKKYSSQREELRLLRSNSFAAVRKLFNRIGELLAVKKIITEKNDVFYLKIDEIFGLASPENIPLMINEVKKRRAEYNSYENIKPLAYFGLHEGEMVPLAQASDFSGKLITGRPCTSGVVRGRVRLFDDFTLPDNIDFDIVVASHTDPGWTALIGISKGLIIEHGGVLSHAAIVSRELGIPTVIGAAGALSILKNGQMVELNGSTGTIQIL